MPASLKPTKAQFRASIPSNGKIKKFLQESGIDTFSGVVELGELLGTGVHDWSAIRSSLGDYKFSIAELKTFKNFWESTLV